MNSLTPFSQRQKSIVQLIAFLQLLLGLPFAFGFLCIVPVIALNIFSRSSGALGIGVFTLAVLTCGVGFVVYRHARQSLANQSSPPLRLWSLPVLVILFAFSIAVGLVIGRNNLIANFLFPPVLYVAATLPPLFAVAWFTRRHTPEVVTWRRATLAALGGATLGVFVAIVIELVLPTLVFALVRGLANRVLSGANVLIDALAGRNVATALTSPSFFFLFVQLALIAPLAEEFAKPLVVLPWLRGLARREAFVLGALAGVGFAALENVLYASFTLSAQSALWAGILTVRAVGCAIHPLGAGLVSMAWRDVLRHEPNGWAMGMAKYGAAVGVHALWNGGSLLVITLAGAQFFGRLPQQVDILGLSAASTTLAFLIVLGLAALWVGRALAHQTDTSQPQPTIAHGEFVLSERALAIWALACLAAIVPAGVAGLRLLWR